MRIPRVTASELKTVMGRENCSATGRQRQRPHGASALPHLVQDARDDGQRRNEMPRTNSLVIRNARVIDGTGAASRHGDVAVKDGVIAAVGAGLATPAGAREIDAGGRAVAPGFIDVHTHFDPQICWDRLATPMLEHGVTTVLMGNCSLSLAPVKASDRRHLAGMFRQIEDIPLEAFAEGVAWDWETYPQYLQHIRRDLGINVAGLVGHSALRLFVMGPEAQERAATEAEIAAMSA